MYHFSKAAIAAAMAVGNSGVMAQHQYVVNMRAYNHGVEQRHAQALRDMGMLGADLYANAARTPADVWRDFDAQTKAVMLGDDGGMGLLLDLEPLARNVGIGKLVSEYRRGQAGDLEVRSSLDGNHAKPVNNGGYDYDGTLILVHSTQVGRQWREYAAMLAEGWDELRDDQENAVRNVRRRMIDNMINGTPNITFKGYQSYGIKSNPNTLALNLGAGGVNVDITSASATYADIRKAFVAAMSALQGPANNATGNVTFYVSSAAWFNFMRVANDQTSTTETILDALLRIPGVAGIKKSDGVTGNEFLAIILSAEYIRPVVGMPVTNTPIQRVTPMDEWNVLVWSASGLQIKADANGRSGVLYARAV